jgi:hypothetical protein
MVIGAQWAVRVAERLLDEVGLGSAARRPPRTLADQPPCRDVKAPLARLTGAPAAPTCSSSSVPLDDDPSPRRRPRTGRLVARTTAGQVD